MTVIQHTNGTLAQMIVKTKNGCKHYVGSMQTFTTNKENPITHTKFNITGKEKFKPVSTYRNIYN